VAASSIIPNKKLGGHIHPTKQRNWWPCPKKSGWTYPIQRCPLGKRTLRLLQPLHIPDSACQDITMDFIEGLPKSEGFNCILVVVDRFSKYAHFIPLKHPFTAPQVAHVMLDVVVRLHGMPKSIVSDRDRISLNNFWKELFKLYNTTLLTRTTYHP
jgi:hypothetical protein